MKKIMIAAAIVSAAVVSQAASIKWQMGNGANGDSFANQFIYAVTAANYEAAIKDLTENSGAKFLSDYAIANGSNAYQAKANVRGGASVGTEIGDNSQFALFVFTDGIVDGKLYQTTGLIGDSSYLYEPPSAAEKTLNLGTSSSSFTTSGTIASIPEPTSGLLLLLGMAGLALRRKQK